MTRGGIPWRAWSGSFFCRLSCRPAVLLAALLAIGVTAPVVHAQEFKGEGADEIRMLRQAAAREAAGDLAGAERILHTILEGHPASLSALLALEDLLRMQGRLEELIPAVDR